MTREIWIAILICLMGILWVQWMINSQDEELSHFNLYHSHWENAGGRRER